MAKQKDSFVSALEGKQIPILTLDNTWHRLFTQTDPTPEILSYESELNDLLKKQGKLTTETKQIRVIKKKLMDEIVQIMDEMNGNISAKVQKQLDEKKRLIEDCNKRLEDYEDELHDLPRMIKDVNYKLMLATMETCYDQIQANNEQIEEISAWVDKIRIELKKNVVIKQQKLQRNQNFYTYMHNIFGADVIELFDLKYGVKPVLESEMVNGPKKQEGEE
ncbi:MAG: hypothetical protein MJ107_08075 [Lachnospiraceae bacterium]|nr:hypothetical protein [Lachnospiraceae bacterium]